jgi:hypothetical protein
MSRRLLVLLVPMICAWGLLAVPSVASCPFCNAEGQTLTKEINLASLVIFGTLKEGKLSSDGIDGTTDFIVENTIKRHDILDKAIKKVDGKQMLTLSRYLGGDREKNYKWVIFCDVFKGKIDPYRGMPVKKDSDPSKYLAGALAVKDKPQPERLKFFFKYLDDPDVEISNDAYKEFAYADYKDYKDMAKELPADKIAGWLQDPKTPTFRYGLYGSLIGHCGTDKHAKVIRKMLDDPERRLTSGIEGLLAGYVLLQKKEGWDYVRGILKDTSKEFTTRYSALRTTRFFWDFRPDVVSKKDIVEAVSILLDQPDVADLAIEDLRKWQAWDKTDGILDLWNKNTHDIPIIKRSIVRYALCCPAERAKAFVAERRKADPDAVQSAEDLLKLEANPPAAATPAPTASKTTK